MNFKKFQDRLEQNEQQCFFYRYKKLRYYRIFLQNINKKNRKIILKNI